MAGIAILFFGKKFQVCLRIWHGRERAGTRIPIARIDVGCGFSGSDYHVNKRVVLAASLPSNNFLDIKPIISTWSRY
jgi:hypothetical protein